MLETKPASLPTMGELHLMQRQRLTDRHDTLMERILKENSHKEKYWILGQAKTKRKHGRTTITPILKALDVQPEVMKEAYLYEVNNLEGSRKLLWVMHPNDKLSLPSINKSLCVSGATGAQILVPKLGHKKREF